MRKKIKRKKPSIKKAVAIKSNWIKDLIGWSLVLFVVFTAIAALSSYDNLQNKNTILNKKLLQASTMNSLNEDDSKSVSFIATGDILLARYIESVMRGLNDYSYPFRTVAQFLRSADVTFGSLNNVLIPGKNNPTDSMVFRGDPQAASGLSFAGFDVMAVANKQLMNYEADGLVRTLTELKNVNVKAVGAGKNVDEAHTPVIIESRGQKIAVYAYVDSNLAPRRKDGAAIGIPGLAEMNTKTVENDVKNALKQANFVVVSMHAGSEYNKIPTKFQKDFAHAAIDAGASVVIGHHAHVVQPVEYYKNGIIFYGLGNFVFDQFFSDDVRNGLVAKIYFTKNAKPVADLFPVRIDGVQPKILEGKEREDMLKKMGLN